MSIALQTPRSSHGSGKPVLIALIGGIFTLLAASIVLIPWIFEQCSYTYRPAPPPILETKKLYDIEKQLIPLLEEGPAQYNDLRSYFKAANEALFQHLESIAREYREKEDHRGATYIAGTSGVGKSYLITQLDMLPRDATHTIKLSKLLGEPDNCLKAVPLPDLQTTDEHVVFNRLMGFAEPQAFDFHEFLVHAGAKRGNFMVPFIIIDDLDEIHEDSAKLLLEQLERYVTENGNRFLHFLVFGRPEGFWPWLKHSDRLPPEGVTNSPYVLRGPEYETTGDLEFRCNNYYQWKYKRDAPQDVTADFMRRLQTYPFLRYTIRSLAAGNFVLNDSIVCYQTKSKRRKPLEQLKSGLFSDFLDRNKESHGRPSMNDDQYVLLLERTAAFPLENERHIDTNGFFEVYSNDFVQLTDREGITRKVRIRDVLNRSGLALLDPSEVRRTRYRFEPFWVHMYLIEKWNQRNHP